MRRVLLVVGALLLVACAPDRPRTSWAGGTVEDITTEALGTVLYSASDLERARNAIGGESFDATTGGGAAVLDLDGDSRLDLALVDGPQVLLLGNSSTPGHPLLRQRGAITVDTGDGFSAHGLAVTDLDQDGLDDLVIAGEGGVRMFRQRSDRAFEPFGAIGEPDDRALSVAVADLDGDGEEDLAVCRWELRKQDGKLLPPASHVSLFLRRAGDFVEWASPLLAQGVRSFICGFADFDEDGQLDMYLGSDVDDPHDPPDRVLHNVSAAGDAAPAFVDVAGTSDGLAGAKRHSMGMALVGGSAAVARTTIGAIELLQQQPTGYHSTRTWSFPPQWSSGEQVAWGIAAADLDRDGQEELVAAFGDLTGDSSQPAVLLAGDSAPLALAMEPGQRINARGVVPIDLDGDGTLELLLTPGAGSSFHLLRASGGDGHWLRVRVVDVAGRPAIGASVRVEAAGRSFSRQLIAGGIPYCDSDHVLDFGVAAATDATVEVRCPGSASYHAAGDFPAGRLVSVRCP